MISNIDALLSNIDTSCRYCSRSAESKRAFVLLSLTRSIAKLTSSILLHARHSWIKLRSALAYCKIALRLLFEEVEKKMERIKLQYKLLYIR